MGAVSEGFAGGLMIIIRQPHHKGYSGAHWHPGTSVVDDARRLDGAKSLQGVQIRIPSSARVRSPWCMGVRRQFSRCSCTSASSSPRLRTDLRSNARAYPKRVALECSFSVPGGLVLRYLKPSPGLGFG